MLTSRERSWLISAYKRNCQSGLIIQHRTEGQGAERRTRKSSQLRCYLEIETFTLCHGEGFRWGAARSSVDVGIAGVGSSSAFERRSVLSASDWGGEDGRKGGFKCCAEGDVIEEKRKKGGRKRGRWRICDLQSRLQLLRANRICWKIVMATYPKPFGLRALTRITILELTT